MQYVQARNFTRGRTKPIRAIVIHTMECSENHNSAEATAAYFTRPDTASAHYCVDDDSVVQCVQLGDTAWHAAGGNSDTIGIEHAGRAGQGPAEWADDYSVRLLRNQSAPLVASLCKQFDIPIRKISPEEYNAGARGILGHIDITRAKNISGGHWDPGPNFPWDQYLSWVAACAGIVKPVAPTPNPVDLGAILRYIAYWRDQISAHPVRMGARGEAVVFIQKCLRNHGRYVTVDGVWGPQTDAAVRAFQRSRGLVADGIVGRATMRALLAP